MKSLFLAATLVVTPLHAAVLSNYTFTGNSLAATTPTAGVTAGSVTNGGGLLLKQSGFNLGGGSSNPALGWSSGQLIPGSVSEALTQNQFFTFTLTPNAGQRIDLSSIAFYGNLGANTNVARSFELQASTNGGDFATVGSGTLVLNTTGPSALFDITLTSYTAITSQTTFRYVPYDVAYDGLSWNDGNWIRFDDITVNGTVSPIPEAGGMALMAVGLVGLASRRCRA